MLRKLIAVLVLILSSIVLKAQVNKTDSIANVLEQYSLQHKSSTLFVHFDKNVYTNNDQVWFTGYLLKSITNLDSYNTLYLSLVSDADSSVVLQQKFLIDKGFAYGGFNLPDSIQSGSYKFVANTNIKLNGKPDAEFIQPIVIKSSRINPLTANLSVFKINDEKTGNGTVLLKALTSDNRFIADAEVSYIIGKGNQILQKGKLITSVIGEIMINYPSAQITADNNLISVIVKKDKYLRYEKIELPINNRYQFQVNFYPEGGYLVSGVESKVGWEIKDFEGAAISAKAIIYANDKILDTISTNSFGMGSFYLLPKVNVKYVVKLINENALLGNYMLPDHLNYGANIKFTSAIGNNELRLSIEGNATQKVHLIVHDYERLYSSTELNLNSNKASRILLRLDSVPIGLNSVTLLDSLYRPIAERIFFAHYDEIEQLEINGAKEHYTVRDSVKLNLKLLFKDKPISKGLVSIEVVQANRVNLSNKKNIVDYNYFENSLGAMPPNFSGIKFNDLSYLEDVLLIKGWRKYKWPEQTNLVQNHQNNISEIQYSGAFTKGKKPLKLPIEINTITGGNVNVINTDSSGKFILPFQALISEPKRKIWLSIGGKNFLRYDIKINEPFDEIKSHLKNLTLVNNLSKTAVLSASESITSLSGIKLNDVTIKSSRDNSIGYRLGAGINPCGDYVCQYGILNCNNHSSGTMPIKGKTYPSNGRSIIYPGCLDEEKSKSNFLILNSIELPKEFYISDINNKNEPINFSTIYWNYQTVLNDKIETPITFTTGDLTGEFRVIVQGVTERGVVYGEKLISVKK
ncbi:hypothetical protein QWY86_02035 [Pedobacter aquatilis]|uniref:hypothetical protein n=1 Tax=Pedobacter aquatilis TaxID=351343 RepID=UPI0025B331CD|nr:hypothetical protein [Pedobacter aquatilis]MDN3585429.1 hypothetical protein [Pedobacter aquatilis]